MAGGCGPKTIGGGGGGRIECCGQLGKEGKKKLSAFFILNLSITRVNTKRKRRKKKKRRSISASPPAPLLAWPSFEKRKGRGTKPHPCPPLNCCEKKEELLSRPISTEPSLKNPSKKRKKTTPCPELAAPAARDPKKRRGFRRGNSGNHWAFKGKKKKKGNPTSTHPPPEKKAPPHLPRFKRGGRKKTVAPPANNSSLPLLF